MNKKIFVILGILLAFLFSSVVLYRTQATSHSSVAVKPTIIYEAPNQPEVVLSLSPEEISEKNITPLTNNMSPKTTTALLANGCFWCVEHDLREVDGVLDVVSGYADGTTKNPTYENYIAGGHREVVLVTYDANKVSYANLVEHIIKHGDPTDAAGSFNDRGPQYAPAIYFATDAERNEAARVVAAIDAMGVFASPLPMAIIPRVEFWPAEEYHQQYAAKNPLRYGYYRNGSGRNAFIKKYWGDKANVFAVTNPQDIPSPALGAHAWENFVKPTTAVLRTQLTAVQYEVTQEEGTERPFENAYDKNNAEGIYVDIVSGEPLYLSKDKYDSGTGWPSFVAPISPSAVVLKEDTHFFSTRIEVRSRFADSHIGHVFDDGPTERGGKRYCMNSAALRFVPLENMDAEGYGQFIELLK